MTLPYWDWPDYRADLELSIADMGVERLDNGIVPEAHAAGLAKTADTLKAQGVPGRVPDRLATLQNQKFDSGNRLGRAR